MASGDHPKYTYRDAAHPMYRESLKAHNVHTLKLVKTVAEFAQNISLLHEQFASQIHNLVDIFQKKHQDLAKERPVDCPSSLTSTWDTLLQETQHDAQAHADTANLLIKNVYTPLLEIASYKKSQSKKLHSFRETFEASLEQNVEKVQKRQKLYIEAYQTYRGNAGSREAKQYIAAYHNAHNDYVLQLKSSNCLQEEFHSSALPYLLEELEEIHIDLANTLSGAIESHALLLLTKAGEQSRRFESITKVCKQVNPALDIHQFIICLGPNAKFSAYEKNMLTFSTPAAENQSSELSAVLHGDIVFDQHTDGSIKASRLGLQKEALEFASFLTKNKDITNNLMTLCQRNLANHQYAKVYETQEDLCRKRNEIRMAQIQLAAIRLQIELLTPKQNGTTASGESGASGRDSPGGSKKSSIRSMWRKAFKSLKPEKSKGDKEKDKEKGDKGEEAGASSMADQSSIGRRSSLTKKGLKHRDSKEKDRDSGSGGGPPGSEDMLDSSDNLDAMEPRDMDPIFKTLVDAQRTRRAMIHQSSVSSSTGADNDQPYYSPRGKDEGPYGGAYPP